MLLKRRLNCIFESLRDTSFSVLMLDYDGTLAPFRLDRGKALIYPGLSQGIEKIMDTANTRIAIVTGRTVEDLSSLLKLKTRPEIWGSHGWERQSEDGSYYLWPADKSHLKGLTEAKAMIGNLFSDKHYEDKPRSVALHWRGLSLDEMSSIKRFADKSLRDLADNYGLELRDFDGGVELRIPGRNKGDVVKSLISESPKDSFFAYLGDDLTDEDAFKAIKGRGVGILVSESERPTSAEYLIHPPGELLEFLKGWIISVQGGLRSAD